MELVMITSSDKLWNTVRDYAKDCSWSAGKSLAEAMDNHLFTEWERVIAALEDRQICGYCRGNRLSQKLIQYAMDYLKSISFDKVYIVSDHENLYEKYGFEVVDRKTAPWGSTEKIYMQRLV